MLFMSELCSQSLHTITNVELKYHMETHFSIPVFVINQIFLLILCDNL